MTTKKDCVFRATMDIYRDRDFAQREADQAEALNYRGYEAIIKGGKECFKRDMDEIFKEA